MWTRTRRPPRLELGCTGAAPCVRTSRANSRRRFRIHRRGSFVEDKVVLGLVGCARDGHSKAGGFKQPVRSGHVRKRGDFGSQLEVGMCLCDITSVPARAIVSDPHKSTQMTPLPSPPRPLRIDPPPPNAPSLPRRTQFMARRGSRHSTVAVDAPWRLALSPLVPQLEKSKRQVTPPFPSSSPASPPPPTLPPLLLRTRLMTLLLPPQSEEVDRHSRRRCPSGGGRYRHW